MREVLSSTTSFLLLAAVGIEPGHAQGAKSCKTGLVAVLLADC